VNVVKVPQSGGVVQRTPQHRRAARAARIKEYFYGSPHPERRGAGPALSPSILELRFSDVKICRVGGSQVSGGLLPLGQASMLGPMRVARVKPSPELLHSVLAVCHPVLRADGTVVGQGDDAEVGQEILDANAAGFVLVTEVDMVGRRMSVLSPCPGGLPSDVLILGSVQWTE
jgi:polyribonucleotide 5'-hydroxyl-kinase